jgi:hypothetical protein
VAQRLALGPKQLAVEEEPGVEAVVVGAGAGADAE